MADTRLPGDAPDSDLEWHAWPPRQQGGQQVRPKPGVLVIHRPTGLAAISTEERSQLRNREVAGTKLVKMLATRTAAHAYVAIVHRDWASKDDESVAHAALCDAVDMERQRE